ncbi:MAG: cytochrome P450, partial [Hyphomonadaceae bacterium]
LGLPTENFGYFHKLSHDLIYTPNTIWKEQGEAAAKAARKATNDEIEAFLADILRQRKASPGDDVISMLLASEVNGRPVTDEEALNMTTLLFFAGTDSTAASITYAHVFLATHPGHKRQIIARLNDPDFIWQASEELLRFNGFHHMSRSVTRDGEFAGVQLKAGDMIVLPTASANRDAGHYPDPASVDFSRENARTHLTFGAGVHRCLGSHLATLQLRIALEEVHAAIPDYELDGPVEFISGGPKITPFRAPMRFASRA